MTPDADLASTAAADDLVGWLADTLRAMPPAAAMGIRPVRLTAHALELRAPLAANVNDKGSAFGGSLASAMTLAAWGLVAARLRGEGIDADVYVADSQVRYLAPVKGDLHARAHLADEADWPAFVRCVRERGRGRLALVAQVDGADGAPVATLKARFAALRPAAGPGL